MPNPARQALLQVLNACDVTLTDSEQISADPTLIRTDFLSLLAILSHNITKAALVLNPSSPSYTAAVPPLTEIAAKLISISHCVHLFTPAHGQAFANEATSLARQIVDAVRSLAQTLNATIERPAIAGNDYLVRTAAVHDLIDKARSPDGLSADNVSAVRKLWLNDQASLVDGYEELVQMIEGVPNEGEEFDDGWDDLDLGTVPLSAIEIERAKKVCSRVSIYPISKSKISRQRTFFNYPLCCINVLQPIFYLLSIQAILIHISISFRNIPQLSWPLQTTS